MVVGVVYLCIYAHDYPIGDLTHQLSVDKIEADDVRYMQL
jgi:hypothetical protein